MLNTHITSHGDTLTAQVSTGEQMTGTLNDVVDAIRSRGICADDLTMPDKLDADSPGTGQRIAIYRALKQQARRGEHDLVDRTHG